MSVTLFYGQTGMDSKLGMGRCMFKVPAELLMYSASLTLLLYQSASRVSTDVSLHCNWILCPGFHIWDAMALVG